MSEHLYMFYDVPSRIDIEIAKINGKANLTFLADAFGIGDTWSVISHNENSITVRIKCSLDGLKIFMMQYADKDMKIIGPESIKQELNEKIKESCMKLLNRIDEK